MARRKQRHYARSTKAALESFINSREMAAARRYYEREVWLKIDVRKYVRSFSEPLQGALGLSPADADRLVKLALAETALESPEAVIDWIIHILNHPNHYRGRYLSRAEVPISPAIASRVRSKQRLQVLGHLRTVDVIRLTEAWASSLRIQVAIDTNSSRDIVTMALAMFAYEEADRIAARVERIISLLDSYVTPSPEKFDIPVFDFSLMPEDDRA